MGCENGCQCGNYCLQPYLEQIDSLESIAAEARKILGKLCYNWAGYGMGYKYCIHCNAHTNNETEKTKHKPDCPTVLGNLLLEKIDEL